MATTSNTKIIYKGGWQFGDTIRQELQGPIGDGEVLYPNGDHFKGSFHLNYAHINGSAYAADGRYDFADGSYIEKAWIHTSDELKPEYWGLHGVFRVHHLGGPDSIAMFVCGQRYGFELFFDQKGPKVKEWYAGKGVLGNESRSSSLEVADYELDETSRVDCITLDLTLKTDAGLCRIVQTGGRYSANQYDNYYYEPSTSVTVYLPGGDSIDHFGTSVRAFRPYDGYVTIHNAQTGMCRSEQWKEGRLEKAEEWKRDVRAAKSVEIPDPFGQGQTKAFVWADGYIDYRYSGWFYEGEVANDRPEGKGVLTGDSFQHPGLRYEGEWKNGVFQDPKATTEPIVLHAKYGRKEWSISNDGKWEWKEKDFEAKLGSLDYYIGGLNIARIEQGCITLTRYDSTELLTPGQTVSFYQEVEGREWSDGCVYNGTDYQLILTWIK